MMPQILSIQNQLKFQLLQEYLKEENELSNELVEIDQRRSEICDKLDALRSKREQVINAALQ